MDLTRYEMETIINFNEEKREASVYTFNGAMRRKLEKLAQERPEECRLEKLSADGRSVTYTIPKSWVRINKPRDAAPLTEEQKQAKREMLKSMQENRRTRQAEPHNTPSEGNYTTEN
ncbi:MAG: molecular chaperone [Clostridiales bacterium]|nr:molecular chaperone [Candidatus Cacconaster stercorequi]